MIECIYDEKWLIIFFKWIGVKGWVIFELIFWKEVIDIIIFCWK